MSAKSKGLPLYKQKHLASIVEANGGREAFSASNHNLSKLLDKYPHYYGKKGSAERRTCANKVYKWRHKSEAEYLKILNKLQVKAYDRRREKKRLESESSDSSETIDEEESPSYPSAKISRLESPKQSMSKTLPPRTSVIQYDERNPECHGGLACVLKSREVRGHDNRTFYEGFDIWLEMDPR